MTLYDCRQPDGQRRGIEAAVGALRRGGLVVLPTDTLYGIGADAFNATAVAAINVAKGRTIPPPVLIGDRDAVDDLVTDLPDPARRLMAAFWPGALTVVVRYDPGLGWDIGSADGTVGLRMPRHELALEVLRRSGPAAVSSANRHHHPPVPTATAAQREFGAHVDVYLEVGALPDDKPSTVVDATREPVRVLRPGALTVADLRRVVPDIADVAPSQA